MPSSIDERKKVIDNMIFQNIDGRVYMPSEQVPDFKERLDIVKNVNMRDDDVLCVGFPRCGNHWAYEVGSMILEQNLTFSDDILSNRMLEWMEGPVVENLEKMPSPRMLCSHLTMEKLPIQVVEKKIPIIYLMRNPKDALVSYWKLSSSRKENHHRFMGTWDDFFELHLAGVQLPYPLWFDHVLSADAFMKTYPDHPVYIHSFEKIKQEPVTAVKDLCKFLGKPCTLAEEIARITEFSSMKFTLKAGKLQKEEEIYMKQESEGYLPHGKSGTWKDVFTVAQSERFDQLFHGKLVGCKLADYVIDYL